MIKNGKILAVIIACCFSFFAMASDVTVSATVDRNEMRAGDTFTLRVNVSSGSSIVVGQPQLPNLQNFSLINQWQNSSTQSTIVNGSFEIKRSQNFNYMLSVNKEGMYTIGSVAIDVNGNVHNTKPIRIKVHNAAAQAPNLSQNQRRQQRRQQQRANDPFQQMDDAFSRLLKQRPSAGFVTEPVNPKEAFFIQVEVDKTEVYAGEQVTASWYIYTRNQIKDIDTLKYPSLNKFWKEDIELANRLNFRREVINGIPYQKALLASYALFPIKPGTAVVDSYKAKCTVISRTNFGFGKPYVYTKASKPVKIKVLPLPTPTPNDFTGAVGQFTANVKLDSTQAPVNQPVSLKIRFEGRGNAKLIDLPTLDLPNSIEIYDTKSESKFFKDGRSFKDFEVLLIPRDAGAVKVPSMKLTFFDPDRKSYYEQSTPELNLNVVPGKGGDKLSDSRLKGDTSAPEKVFAPTILLNWEDTSGSLLRLPQPIFISILFAVSLLFLAWRVVKEFGLGQKKQNLEDALKAKINQGQGLINEENYREAAVVATNIVYFVLGQLTGSVLADENVEKILKKLPPSVRNTYSEEIVKILTTFEVIGFAPEELVANKANKKDMTEQFKKLEKLMMSLIKDGFLAEEDLKSVRV